MRECDDCPHLEIETPSNIKDYETTYVQWESRLQNVFSKEGKAASKKYMHCILKQQN